MLRLAPTLFLVSLLFISCTDNQISDPAPEESQPRELTASEAELVKSNNTFGFDLFREVYAHETEEEGPGNVLVSPLSVSMALGMTLNGAGGQTREEMKAVLQKEGMSIEEINSSYRSLIDLLVTLDPEVQMNVANSLWYREGKAPGEEFQNTIGEYFGAAVEGVDFDDQGTVDRINRWVEHQTEGLIGTIVEPPIPPEMMAYLINAIYFKGTWTNEFAEEDTEEAPFVLQDGESVEVEMMNQSESRYAILKNDEVELLDIPYGDSLYSMTLMMPADESKPIGTFLEENINSTVLNGWFARAEAHEIAIAIPKFTVEYDIKLPEVLKALGMVSAFSDRTANFSNMYGDFERFYISEFKHDTFIEVNEKGTEAAAVTSVGVALTSMPPSIRFDRPFIYLIRERTSGTILFIGSMGNPAAG